MYKIAVSPEQLEAFARRIEEFKKIIILECDILQQQADKFRPFVDETTGLALVRPVKEIISIVADNENSLKELSDNAYAYASTVRNIQRKIEAEHRYTPKEKACGIASGVIMHEHIKAVDSEYQTMDGYMISRTKSIVGNVASVVETISGVSLKPQLVPTDEAHIDGQMDNAIRLIDGQMALRHPHKRIDPSGTPIPQEQIDLNTLVIDDASEPWKNSNEN